MGIKLVSVILWSIEIFADIKRESGNFWMASLQGHLWWHLLLTVTYRPGASQRHFLISPFSERKIWIAICRKLDSSWDPCMGCPSASRYARAPPYLSRSLKFPSFRTVSILREFPPQLGSPLSSKMALWNQTQHLWKWSWLLGESLMSRQTFHRPWWYPAPLLLLCQYKSLTFF